MMYQAVELGSRLFHELESRQRYYDEYLVSDSSSRLRSMTNLDVRAVSRLILFLNQWSTRYRTPAEDLLEAIESVAPIFKNLHELTLLDADFDGSFAGDCSVKEAIQIVFDAIVKRGPRVETTGTSKILHMINPDLFVMWDAPIRGGYAVGKSAEDYSERFLPRVQGQVRLAMRQYSEATGVSKTEVVEHFTQCGHTLAKVIDEFNYVKFTLKIDQVRDVESREN